MSSCVFELWNCWMAVVIIGYRYNIGRPLLEYTSISAAQPVARCYTEWAVPALYSYSIRLNVSLYTGLCIVWFNKTETNDRGNPLRWPCNTLYPQKLALTSPKSGGRSVGIVRSRTKATEFFLRLDMKVLGSVHWACMRTESRRARLDIRLTCTPLE
jgi:hypothetical protein